jgi:hypothetical protein
VFRMTVDPALRTLLLASGTLLVSPYVFNYDMTALTAAILWVMLTRGPLSMTATVALGAAWIAPAATWTLNGSGLGLSPLAYGGAFIVAVKMILDERTARVSVARAMPQPA